ncbi:MAG: pyridoxal phosphate-dependent aminotransferase [Gammaproteobacteria bacterium]|nr:pyridoxal phosphate-dependent aminotransferase [Gammaproteobacteria bacterium]
MHNKITDIEPVKLQDSLMTHEKSYDSTYTGLIANYAADIRMSAIKEMAMLSAQLGDVASLTWGLPSFRTPEYIRHGIIKQLADDEDIGKYALPDGLKDLRSIVARQHRLSVGVDVEADDQVMITAGNMQAMSSLLHAIVNPGDEIILTDPCFSSHIQQVKLYGGKPVYWPLDEANDWVPDMDVLSTLVSNNTKAIVIVSPSNPTGKIFGQQTLMAIGELAREHGFLILIDDPYSYFLYENRQKYFNLASVPEFSENTVYMFSFSKAYAMSGWRLGYMILPAWLKAQIIKIHDLNMICTPRISQVAAKIALTGEPYHIKEFEAIFARRRALICQRLDNMPDIFGYIKPQGAYYVFPKIRVKHNNAHDFCLDVLYQAKVALTPGSAFGPSGEGHVRMAYCVSDETINMAFDRLENYFAGI